MSTRFSRVLIVVFLLLLTIPSDTRAQLTETVRFFDEGNRLYLLGDYTGALSAYQSAEQTGYAGGALFHNMGNTYYRLDEIGQAIRYYHRTARLLPDDPRVRHNLQIAQASIVDRFSTVPEPVWQRYWQALVSRTGASGLFFTGLFFYLAAAALFAYRFWTGIPNEWLRRARAAATGAGVVLLVAAFAASLSAGIERKAVILESAITVYESPIADTDPVLDVHEGLVVDILGSQASWSKIRLPNGVTGWIESRAMAEI